MRKIINFRDSGGLSTSCGAEMKRGLIFRSGSLDGASNDDLSKLRELGIGTVCDLRSLPEVKSNPDRLPHPAAKYVNLPITPRYSEYWQSHHFLSAIFKGQHKEVDFLEVMVELYTDFVNRFSDLFSQLLSIIADERNLPVLIHCTGGKDRTGFACALLHALLGVGNKDIMDNYLVSNLSLAQLKSRQWKKLAILRLFGLKKEKMEPLFQVREAFLQESFSQIDQLYGSLDNYISRGLGLDNLCVQNLRSLLLTTHKTT